MERRVYYAIEYLGEDGLWVEWQTFERPLDADRAYERLRTLRPVQAIQLVHKDRIARDER